MEQENPFNNNNSLISEQDVLQILKKYNITNISINDISKFQTAFTHKSYMRKTYNFSDIELEGFAFELGNNVVSVRDYCYEELEFYGDAVLDFITVLYITDRFPDQNEGFYTKLKSKIVNGASLSKLAKKLNFHKYILISQQVEEKYGRFSEKILEDVFEAFIGALFKDQANKFKSFTVCYEFICNILNNVQDDFDYAELIMYDDNYKDQLLRYFNLHKLGHPIYKEISVEESTNMKIFTVGILKPNYKEINSNVTDMQQYVASAVGATKKKAEQLAAKETLRCFGVLNEAL